MDSINKSFKIIDGIVISELNDESVILNLKTGKYFQANELGSFIISHLNEYTTLSDLQDKIIQSFNVTANDCQKDLYSFIEELQDKDLLHFE